MLTIGTGFAVITLTIFALGLAIEQVAPVDRQQHIRLRPITGVRVAVRWADRLIYLKPLSQGASSLASEGGDMS